MYTTQWIKRARKRILDFFIKNPLLSLINYKLNEEFFYDSDFCIRTLFSELFAYFFPSRCVLLFSKKM